MHTLPASWSIRILRCDVFQRADARMRLIQYISGEMREKGVTTRVEKEEEQGRGGRWHAGGHTK